MGEYVRKGSQIYVEGRLRTRDYEKEGQKHYITEIMVDEMQMLGSRGGAGGGDRMRDEAPSRASAPSEPAASSDFQDDDIPF